MTKLIKTIAFDADDTLWHNEKIFLSAREKYKNLLSNYHSKKWIEERLDAADMRNIKHFGYGIKGFTLSMIETAVELTEGRVKGSEIQEIINFAHLMLASPIEVLEGVEETVKALADDFHLMVITQGDLFDQEIKIARSGLGDYFDDVEIVSLKNRGTYQKILDKNKFDAEEFVMVGNSLKSDILPVLEINANAVHIPYEMRWVHEIISEDELAGKDFVKLEKISHLPAWINDHNR